MVALPDCEMKRIRDCAAELRCGRHFVKFELHSFQPESTQSRKPCCCIDIHRLRLRHKSGREERHAVDGLRTDAVLPQLAHAGVAVRLAELGPVRFTD